MRDDSSRDQITSDLVKYEKKLYGKRVDSSTVVVHPGPGVWKSVTLLKVPDPSTGELRVRELRARTLKAVPPEQGGSYGFEETEHHWHCQGDEVEILRQFLNGNFPHPGTYRLIEEGTELRDVLGQAELGNVPPEIVARLLELVGTAPQMVSALAASSDGTLLAEAVELQRRRTQLDELRRLVEDPDSQERRDLHPQLKQMTWIFGGRYIGESRRNELTAGDVLDIPLLRPDGSLHIVELKGANIQNLVHRYRGPGNPQAVAGQNEEVPLIVGREVHEAVGQVMNYLCRLDEGRDHILTRFKIEARRATGTVLIGHPDFVQDFSGEEIASTLRIYNSHLSRIEVMHYKDLIENAERALALAAGQPVDMGDEAADPPSS
jgi:hypothetical protein